MKKLRILIGMIVLCFAIFALTSCGEDNAYDYESEEPAYTPAYEYPEPEETEEEPEEDDEPAADEITTPANEQNAAHLLPLASLLEVTNARRQNLVRPTMDMVTTLVEGREPETVQMGWLWDGVEMAESISSEDAIFDAQAMFDVIRQIYGAYIYFGGDEIFLPIFDYVLDRLAGRAYWDFDDFAALIIDNLSPAISDNHFVINRQSLGIRYNFYVGQTLFARSENGFRNAENGLYVAEVLGHDDLDALFRLSMDQEGEFGYIAIIYLNANPDEYELTLTYENGYSENITLYRHAPTTLEYEPVGLKHVQGFPIVNIMQMGFPASTFGHGFEDARYFLSIAEELRDEPVIIVDIRSNRGGNGMLPQQWLHILLGEIVHGNHIGVRVGSYSSLRHAIFRSSYFSQFHVIYEEFRRYLPFVAYGDNHIIMGDVSQEIVENDQLIILLTDRFTASAGDGFADAMLSIENTLIIGHNTFGVLFTDMYYSQLALPNSGLNFGLGRTVNIHPEGHLQEGIGVAPDIWFTGDDILAAVTDMLVGYLGE